MKNQMVFIVIVIVVILAVAIVGAYFYFNKNNRRPGFPRNFQLNESQINDVTNFFNSNPTQDEIMSYCETNRGNCFYFCRNINGNNEYCKQIMNFTRQGNFTQNGNFSRRGNFSRDNGGISQQ